MSALGISRRAWFRLRRRARQSAARHGADKFLAQRLAAQNPALHEKITEIAQSKYGLSFQPLDKTKIAALSDAEKAEVENVRIANNQATLAKVAVLPAIMFLCYLGLIFNFKSRSGYRQVHMEEVGRG